VVGGVVKMVGCGRVDQHHPRRGGAGEHRTWSDLHVSAVRPGQVLDAEELAEHLLSSSRTQLGGLNVAHARRVAAGLGDADARLVAAALLHDVLEKGDVDEGRLGEVVADDRVMELVVILTKRQHESDEVYLARCAGDPDALAIKRLDLLDKLTTEDVHVNADVADGLRTAARRRLAMLDALVAERCRRAARR
jgi:(p)ppGpp synthase/HD superfamily hydrolase